MVSLHATIKGRVQGVCYRYFACEEARAFGLNGWVRNMGNNDVEVLAEGNKELLKQYLEVLRQGPPLARVSDIVEDWSDEEEGITGFLIKY